ncbi:hypothetical protein [Parathalassolituus penaei]|uniref:Uncharacterized protein n=1 Tax=Parathalassolituus penaei TaxID=2997323 RepID=A0A9X3ITV3_9GAMM|nr:hypothetical protein [Parathalassolituus penaei]MCY0965543.1 hypothetical protein [Parathalassolituus penaei]
MASIVSFMRTQHLAASENLVQRIRGLAESHQCAALVCASKRLVIRGDIGRYFDPDNLLPTLHELVLEGQCDWQRLDAGDSSLKLLSAESGRNLEDLLWTLAFNSYTEERNCMHMGCRRDDVVRLQHWPNLTRVPASRNTFRLAALFSARPTSIALAGKILGINECEVLRFYSAAWSAGLVTRVNRVAEPVKLVQHRNHSLIGALMKHLRKESATA